MEIQTELLVSSSSKNRQELINSPLEIFKCSEFLFIRYTFYLIYSIYFWLTNLYILQAVYPLVTALLCISQKQFFLTNWGGFLNMCLNSIKVRKFGLVRCWQAHVSILRHIHMPTCLFQSCLKSTCCPFFWGVMFLGGNVFGWQCLYFTNDVVIQHMLPL